MPRRWTWHRKARSRLLIWRYALWCHPSNDFMYLSPPWLGLISTILSLFKHFISCPYTGCLKKMCTFAHVIRDFVVKTKITIWGWIHLWNQPLVFFFSKVLLDRDNFLSPYTDAYNIDTDFVTFVTQKNSSNKITTKKQEKKGKLSKRRFFI